MELTSSLLDLSRMLHEHYGKAPIVIIDEYDTPIQQGHMNGFYDKVILFMRNLFSSVMKDNKHLSYGFLTGILRVAKESIFSFLLVAGYLKAVECNRGVISDYMCRVAIPNREISFVYRKEILQKLEYMLVPSAVTAIQEALYTGDSALLQNRLEDLLLKSASCFDTAGESFYQRLMLGLTAAFEPYIPQSNKESGSGRYDIQLTPKKKGLPGIIIELKAQKNCTGDELKKLAKTARKQIDDKKYDTELKAAGVKNIMKYGVAFSGKNVAVITG